VARAVEPDLLRNADAVVKSAGLDRYVVFDADVHHLAVVRFLGAYLEEPWRHILQHAPADQVLAGGSLGDRGLAGRIQRPRYAGYGATRVASLDEGNPPAPIRELVGALDRIGDDYALLFPNDLLDLSRHTQVDLEVAVARGYARWVTERILAHERRLKALLYLPLRQPQACLDLIEAFGDSPGVVGYLLTGKLQEQLHRNENMAVFRAIEERQQVIGFHGGGGNWHVDPYPVFSSFLAAHALSFPMSDAIPLADIVLSGIPERFPKLRFIFFEAGAAWLLMVMGRLDTAFLMRPSEAPLLRRRPSEYMRDFYYTVQPLERPENLRELEPVFDLIGRRQILYASDWPHWDYDMPNSITDLPFLSEDDKRDILAYNAIRAFGMDFASLAPAGAAAKGEQ
jgi:predicted TIM-barrel fold metal-dependent hydrolase